MGFGQWFKPRDTTHGIGPQPGTSRPSSPAQSPAPQTSPQIHAPTPRPYGTPPPAQTLNRMQAQRAQFMRHAGGASGPSRADIAQKLNTELATLKADQALNEELAAAAQKYGSTVSNAANDPRAQQKFLSGVPPQDRAVAFALVNGTIVRLRMDPVELRDSLTRISQHCDSRLALVNAPPRRADVAAYAQFQEARALEPLFRKFGASARQELDPAYIKGRQSSAPIQRPQSAPPQMHATAGPGQFDNPAFIQRPQSAPPQMHATAGPGQFDNPAFIQRPQSAPPQMHATAGPGQFDNPAFIQRPQSAPPRMYATASPTRFENPAYIQRPQSAPPQLPSTFTDFAIAGRPPGYVPPPPVGITGLPETYSPLPQQGRPEGYRPPPNRVGTPPPAYTQFAGGVRPTSPPPAYETLTGVPQPQDAPHIQQQAGHMYHQPHPMKMHNPAPTFQGPPAYPQHGFNGAPAYRPDQKYQNNHVHYQQQVPQFMYAPPQQYMAPPQAHFVPYAPRQYGM